MVYKFIERIEHQVMANNLEEAKNKFEHYYAIPDEESLIVIDENNNIHKEEYDKDSIPPRLMFFVKKLIEENIAPEGIKNIEFNTETIWIDTEDGKYSISVQEVEE